MCVTQLWTSRNEAIELDEYCEGKRCFLKTGWSHSEVGSCWSVIIPFRVRLCWRRLGLSQPFDSRWTRCFLDFYVYAAVRDHLCPCVCVSFGPCSEQWALTQTLPTSLCLTSPRAGSHRAGVDAHVCPARSASAFVPSARLPVSLYQQPHLHEQCCCLKIKKAPFHKTNHK